MYRNFHLLDLQELLLGHSVGTDLLAYYKNLDLIIKQEQTERNAKRLSLTVFGNDCIAFWQVFSL